MINSSSPSSSISSFLFSAIFAHLDKIQSFALGLVKERRDLGLATENSTVLIDLLISAYDDESKTKLSDIEVHCFLLTHTGSLISFEIRDNALTFLLAGSETTATAMTWFMGNVVRHPEVKKKLQEEVDSFFSTKSFDDFDPDDTDKFPYLHQVLCESMRLTPGLLGVAARVLKQDQTIAGWRFPAGVCDSFLSFVLLTLQQTFVTVSSIDLNVNPDHWGESANEFNPDHFAPDREIDPYQFIPFGAGRRTCIGKLLAIEEMHTVLPYLLYKFDFELDDSQKGTELVPMLVPPVIAVRDDVLLKFTPRH